MKNKRLLIILEIFIVLVFFLGVFFFQQYTVRKDTASINPEELNRRYLPFITYEGQQYPLKRNLTSLLLIGTDNYADEFSEMEKSKEFFNFRIADFLVILVFDNQAKTVTPFQINRDTMCDVEAFDAAGNSLGTRYAQINLSHTAGTGKEDSCSIVQNTVENLLFHVPIDYFLSFTMDAVPIINDLVGGVTVTLAHDVPSLGSKYVKGTTVTLHGRNALTFVRNRDTSQLDSNLVRMDNHRLYMDGFTQAARTAVSKDPDLVLKIFEKTSRYLCTDMSVQTLEKLVAHLTDYTIQPAVYYDGKYDWPEDERWAGYFADEASVFSCVKKVFCQ